MIDRKKTDRSPVDGADVCVVGAGVAGGLVGHSLARRGHRVVILEAGPWVSDDLADQRLERAIRPDNSERVWPEGIDPDRDRATYSIPDGVELDINRQRLKCVGGTTMHWAGEVPRMHPKDFEMDTRYGLAADWPIDYDDLRPYYAVAESELGVAGGGGPFVPREEPPAMAPHPPSHADVLFTEACDELGIETHSVPLAINTETYDGRSQCVGFKTCSPFCPSGARYSGDVHAHKAIEQGAVVLDRVPVQYLEHDSTGNRIEAAVYVTPDGEIRRQTADQFVLACGAIEVPRLLLLSESAQHPDGLANSSGTVGQYLFGSSFVKVQGRLDAGVEQQPIPFYTKSTRQFYEHDDPRPGSIRIRSGKHGPQSPARAALEDDPFETIPGSPWGDELLETLDTRRTTGDSASRLRSRYYPERKIP